MATPKIHFSRIRHIGDRTITGTLCNRMSGAGDDINCTEDTALVTCKFCIRELASQVRMSTDRPNCYSRVRASMMARA